MFFDLWNYIIDEHNGDTVNTLIQIGTFIIAVLTWFGAVIGGIHSLRDIKINRRNKQLSEFIALFSDENETKRLRGIYGITSYSKFLFRELFFICSIENDAIIKELIYDALQKQSPHSKKYSIQINDFIVNCFLQHNYQGNHFDDIRKSSKMMNILKDGRINRRIQLEIDQKNPPGKFEQGYAVDNHLLLSSRLLAYAMKRSFFVRLSGNLVVQSDMYASKWRFVSINNCVFIKNVSRHIFSFATKYRRCYLLDSNYYDSKLIASYFVKCMIKDCLFIHSNFRNTVFNEGEIQHGKFSKSILKRCHFLKLTINQDSLWNSCWILNCNYEQVKITDNAFKGTIFVSVCFDDVKLWRNEFVSQFTKCQFTNVKWGGSKLLGVQFLNCILKNVDFAGANLKNCKFVNCTFYNTNFEKMKTENTDFIDCIRG